MSYGLRVTVKDNVAAVEFLTDKVPDGSWNINGHKGFGTHSVAVHANLDGEQVSANGATYARAEVPSNG